MPKMPHKGRKPFEVNAQEYTNKFTHFTKFVIITVPLRRLLDCHLTYLNGCKRCAEETGHGSGRNPKDPH